MAEVSYLTEMKSKNLGRTLPSSSLPWHLLCWPHYPIYLLAMTCKTEEVKDFLLKARHKDTSVKIKKNKDNVNFKVQCSTSLHLSHHKEKTEKLKQCPAPRFGCEGAEMNEAC